MNDIVARFGGEEFTILLSHTDAGESKILAEQLNQAVVKAIWEEVGSLTVSVGVATFTEKDNETSILVNADRALYTAKRNGRNRALHFDEIE